MLFPWVLSLLPLPESLGAAFPSPILAPEKHPRLLVAACPEDNSIRSNSSPLLPACNPIWDLSAARGTPRVIPAPIGFYGHYWLFLQRTRALLSPHPIFRAAGNQRSPSCPAWDAGNGLVSLGAASAEPIWPPQFQPSMSPLSAPQKMGSQGTPQPPCPIIAPLGSKFHTIFAITEQSAQCSHH